jgi:hypothetical protein
MHLTILPPLCPIDLIHHPANTRTLLLQTHHVCYPKRKLCHYHFVIGPFSSMGWSRLDTYATLFSKTYYCPTNAHERTTVNNDGVGGIEKGVDDEIENRPFRSFPAFARPYAEFYRGK